MTPRAVQDQSEDADDFDDGRIEPGRAFYLALLESNCDGTYDLRCEAPVAFGSEHEAANYVKSQYREHGAQGFVYRCDAVLSVYRGSPKVRRLAPANPETAREPKEGGQ